MTEVIPLVIIIAATNAMIGMVAYQLSRIANHLEGR